jgi:hypothetical protein
MMGRYIVGDGTYFTRETEHNREETDETRRLVACGRAMRIGDDAVVSR